MKPSTQSVTLPRSLTWETTHHPSFSQFEVNWPPGDRADRVVTRNYGIRVVVCLPLFALPYLEETAPIFSHLGVSATPADAETVETVLAAVADHLDPVHGPTDC